jgi:hypothetical protein
VREEARVGQRTTLDVLNAQQDLVNARVALVTAQRDRVVASYTVLAATGALSPQVLALKIEVYDPVVHYQQVRDVWGGARTPDGRRRRCSVPCDEFSDQYACARHGYYFWSSISPPSRAITHILIGEFGHNGVATGLRRMGATTAFTIRPRACRLVLFTGAAGGVRRIAGSHRAAAVRQYRDRVGNCDRGTAAELAVMTCTRARA